MQYREFIGMDAPHLIVELPKVIKSLEYLYFHIYHHFPTREERLFKSADNEFKKTKERESSSANFDVNARKLIAPENFNRFIQETFTHKSHEQEKTVFSVAARELTFEFLSRKISELPQGYFLAVRSACQLQDGQIAHIPMMDFECPPALDNLEAIKIILRNLGQTSGVILESGRSYHYYGFEVLTEDGWLTFLGKCILASPFVHARYVGHSLIRRTCPLRISGNIHKPEVPKVVAIL